MIKDDLITFTHTFEVANGSDYADVSAVSSAVINYRLGAMPLVSGTDEEGNSTLEVGWYQLKQPEITYVKTVNPEDPSKIRFSVNHTVSIPDLMEANVTDVSCELQPVVTSIITYTTEDGGVMNDIYTKELEAKKVMFRPVDDPVYHDDGFAIGNESSFGIGLTDDGLKSYCQLEIQHKFSSPNESDYDDIKFKPVYIIHWKDNAATGEHADEYDSYEFQYDGFKVLTGSIVDKSATISLPFWDFRGNHPFVEGHTYDVYLTATVTLEGVNNRNYHETVHTTVANVETERKTLTFIPEGSVPGLVVIDEFCTITNESEFGTAYVESEDGTPVLTAANLLSAKVEDLVTNSFDFGSSANAGGVGPATLEADVVVYYRKHSDDESTEWSEYNTTCDITGYESEEKEGIVVIVDMVDLPLPDLSTVVSQGDSVDVKVQFKYTLEYGVDTSTTHSCDITRTTDVKTLVYFPDNLIPKPTVLTFEDGQLKVRSSGRFDTNGSSSKIATQCNLVYLSGSVKTTNQSEFTEVSPADESISIYYKEHSAETFNVSKLYRNNPTIYYESSGNYTFNSGSSYAVSDESGNDLLSVYGHNALIDVYIRASVTFTYKQADGTPMTTEYVKDSDVVTLTYLPLMKLDENSFRFDITDETTIDSSTTPPTYAVNITKINMSTFDTNNRMFKLGEKIRYKTNWAIINTSLSDPIIIPIDITFDADTISNARMTVPIDLADLNAKIQSYIEDHPTNNYYGLYTQWNEDTDGEITFSYDPGDGNYENVRIALPYSSGCISICR